MTEFSFRMIKFKIVFARFRDCGIGFFKRSSSKEVPLKRIIKIQGVEEEWPDAGSGLQSSGFKV